MGIELSKVSFAYYVPKKLNEPILFNLKNINLKVSSHDEFIAIVGHTGSGKSTLVQLLNALQFPSSGKVNINNEYIINKEFDTTVDNKKYRKNLVKKPKLKFKLKPLRKYTGLVFQFPEYQLFEETILKDVSFGPKNFDYSDEESEKLAREALTLVGIDESLFDKSPFELSGGQKRRVAIAGIITLKPKVLILDEPTAGLDPQGSRDMMELFKKIHQMGTTIIMITHDMDNVLRYASDVLVMVKGEVVKACKPYELFMDEHVFSRLSIEEPLVIKTAKELNKYKKYHIPLDKVKDITSLVELIAKEKDYE